MSPRRKVDGSVRDFFTAQGKAPKTPLRWGLPVTALLAFALAAAAIAGSVFMLVAHEDVNRTQARDAAALFNVRAFMTEYTSLDPFHANDYADRILAHGTGEFQKSFKEKLNEIVVQVARAEPTEGIVQEAGVQRWNDNGSADILVATIVKSTGPDGKTPIESGTRWVVTTIEEGQQWKISQLIQVI
ncbi:mammalian cell entry protein [Mycolicibacterium sp. 050158]|jgi:Mce-associated membrane protein|uniref:mammalian cell entry protein n=1 Tax=Mycolicibacterium sp. 050158 TaxID=3090602 RepID=UPI00299DCA97|nr:mammalian cell entry protein [Mycolicibacterium sp. 050158]MDX1889408.1 mammalian cell entry protein [Mycolicibacterium sp. 050158]